MLLPIRAEEEGKIVSVHHGEDKVYQFVVPVGKEQDAYSFHYYAAVSVAKWKGMIYQDGSTICSFNIIRVIPGGRI